MFHPHVYSGRLIRHCLILTGIGLILSLAIICCSAGVRASGADPPLSLQELESLCRLPVPCGRPMTCQDRRVTFWGYVDPVNIYSHGRFPELPYEKFRLVDRRHHAVEVWPQAADNRSIFEKLARRPSDRIVVTGRLVAFDMPITGQCHQGVKVVIHDASQIEFK